MQEAIREVMRLQKQFSAKLTDPMKLRQDIIEHGLPDELRAKLPLMVERSGIADLRADGGNGTGRCTGIPWVRIHSESLSPSPTKGWYLVLLFSADGQRVYLSLNQGATKWRKGGFKPQAGARGRAEGAYELLRQQGALPQGWRRDIHLKTPHSKLWKAYEDGNVVAIEYPLDSLPSDEELVDAFLQGLDPLAILYRDFHEFPLEHEPNVWIFQADSKYSNLVEFLSSPATQLGLIDSWSVTRYEEEIRDGDIVLLWSAGKDPGIYGIGRIVGSSYERPEQERQPEGAPNVGRAIDCRLQEILVDRPILRSDLSKHPVLKDLSIIKQKTGRNFRVTSEQWEALQPLLQEDELEMTSVDYRQLARETYWEEKDLVEVIETFDRRPQIILAGPPGTGKTYVAEAIARHLTCHRNDSIYIVQFHPSYSYEDFVEGLQLREKGDTVAFIPVEGKLIEVAEVARKVRHPVVLIIDEINRANIPSVFGELLYLLEYRGKEISLPHRARFSLPKNLYIIATMNTADRSIRSIDTALRRRFDIFDCPPRPDILDEYYKDESDTEVDHLGNGLSKLNEKLQDQIDRHHTIGHSFFMERSFSYEDLARTWDRQIAPLLEEYFFDQPDIANEYHWEDFWPKGSST